MLRYFLPLLLFSLLLQDLNAQMLNQTDDRGRKQGKWQKTYENGSLRYEGQFRDNRPYGTFRYYYKTGELQTENQFSEDGIIAESKMYYRNGSLFAEGKYVNQQKDGLWLYYSEPDHKLIAREQYKDGEMHGENLTYYAETGEILESTHYEEGMKNGPYKKYFPDGKLMTEGKYLNDQLNGLFISYYPNGQVQVRGTYRMGRQTGNWEYFDESGGILTREDFLIDQGDTIREK